MIKNFLNGMKILVVGAALLIGSSTAQAAIGDVYSALFQGVTFTFTQTDADTLTFRLQGTLPLPGPPNGDWNNANFLDAFAIKDLGVNFTTVTATANGPGASNLAGIRAELNNSGGSADCAVTGETGSICFDIVPDTALSPSPNFNMLYTIDFSQNLDISDDGPHLKIAFTQVQNGDKVGSARWTRGNLSRYSGTVIVLTFSWSQ